MGTKSHPALYSIEAEQAVIGGILLDNSTWPKVTEILDENDFYCEQHSLLFIQIKTLLSSGVAVDIITLSEKLKQLNLLERTGGEAYIFELSNNTPSTENIIHYAGIVKRKASLRNIAQTGKSLIKQTSDQNADPAKILVDLAKTIQDQSIDNTNFDLEKACLSYSELLIANIPERKFILPILPQGGLAMLFAPRGLGKTLFSISLAYAVTTESQFMNWPIANNSGVLFIDGEMSLTEMRERITNFASVPPKKSLHLLSHEIFFEKYEHDLRITETKTQNALLKMLDNNQDIKLVVLDNLSSLSNIREDKSDDWRESMLPFLIACRRRGVAILIVHHAGKSGEQRGTGAREDVLDTIIKLSPMSDDNNQGAYFRVDIDKGRSCFGHEKQPFSAKLLQNDGLFHWETTSIEENTKKQLIKLIQDSGEDGLNAKDASDELEISQAMISKYKKQLIADGIIENTKGKKPMKIKVGWRANNDS